VIWDPSWYARHSNRMPNVISRCTSVPMWTEHTLPRSWKVVIPKQRSFWSRPKHLPRKKPWPTPGRPKLGSSRHSRVTSLPLRSTLRHCRPMVKACPSSVSIPITCLDSGIGLVDVIPFGRPSELQLPCRLALITGWKCTLGHTLWISTSSSMMARQTCLWHLL